jgi:hypothetical protein
VTVTIERTRFKARYVVFIGEVTQARPDADRVQSVHMLQQLVPNGSIFLGLLINMCLADLESSLLDILTF